MNQIVYYYNKPDSELQIDIWDENTDLIHHEDVIGNFDDQEDMRQACLEVASKFGKACFLEDLELINNYLLYLNCSQRELARRIKVNERTVRKWIKGDLVPSYANRQLIMSLKQLPHRNI